MNERETWLLLGALLLWCLFKSKRGAGLPMKKRAKISPKTAQKVATGWMGYREQLAAKESAGKYDARRPNSQYWGRYQLGRLARGQTDAKGVRWSKFKTDKDLQDRAVKQWTSRLLQMLQRQPDAAAAVRSGKATWAQLVAMDHLTGRAAVMKWIRTGQITRDGNNVSNLDWGKSFAQYDLSELKKGTT